MNKRWVTRTGFSLHSEAGKGAKVTTSNVLKLSQNNTNSSQSCRPTFREKRRCRKWSCLSSQTGTETFSERSCSPTLTLCGGALRKREHGGVRMKQNNGRVNTQQKYKTQQRLKKCLLSAAFKLTCWEVTPLQPVWSNLANTVWCT